MQVRVLPSTQTTAHPGHLATIFQFDENEATAIPWRIEFVATGLPCHVEGVIVTDPGEASDLVPEIETVTFTRLPGGRPVDGDMIRGIKLGEIRRQAIKQASTPYRRVGDHFVFRPADPVDRRTVKKALAHRRRSITTDDISAAVDAYRAAIAEGRTDRLAAVGNLLGVSTATASRRLTRARDLGLLED